MSVFKLITVQGSRPFTKRTLELIVYKDAVEKVLALLEEGRQHETKGRNFLDHTFIIMQAGSLLNKTRAFEAIKYEYNISWGSWYSRLLLHHYDISLKSPSELKEIFDGIEVIEFPVLEEVSA